MSATVESLLHHFDDIYRERMSGLPIVNVELAVEAVGFAPFEEHELGILITPWFMNLFLLPGTDIWADVEQGTTSTLELPAGRYDFTVSHDEQAGTFLSAILFGTVADFPDQPTARDVADEILRRLRSPEESDSAARNAGKKLSRRELFSQFGAN